MRLYHFTSEHYGLQNIVNRRLKIAVIDQLNDPFELMAPHMADRNFRQAMQLTKRQLSEKYGIICFSRNWKNPVQWAHYADKHKGVCLGFDVSEAIVCPVEYVGERIEYSGKLDEGFMRKVLTTKYQHWSYEKEYRAFTTLETNENGLFFRYFDETMELKEVIVGCQSSLTRKDLFEATKGYNKIDTYKVRPAFKKFEIVKNKDKSLWV